MIAEGRRFSDRYGLDLDWPCLVDRWRREGYLEPIRAMTSGELPWQPIDAVMRNHLQRLSDELGFSSAGDAALDELSGVWDRLDPWPDAAEGLARLRVGFIVAPLSNATTAGLVRLSRHGGLVWDCILSTELFGAYKPDPATYNGAVSLLGLNPEQVALVAAHPSDLAGASRCGLRTVLVPRPDEWGPGPAASSRPGGSAAPTVRHGGGRLPRPRCSSRGLTAHLRDRSHFERRSENHALSSDEHSSERTPATTGSSWLRRGSAERLYREPQDPALGSAEPNTTLARRAADQRSSAHWAGFEGHVERGVPEAPHTERGCGLSQREDLGVRGRISERLPPVAGGSDDPVAGDHHRADRHLTLPAGESRLLQGHAHCLEVVHSRTVAARSRQAAPAIPGAPAGRTMQQN